MHITLRGELQFGLSSRTPRLYYKPISSCNVKSGLTKDGLTTLYLIVMSNEYNLTMMFYLLLEAEDEVHGHNATACLPRKWECYAMPTNR